MSNINIVKNTGNAATANTDRSKVFVFDNRYRNESYNNSGYTDLTLPVGTVMGRVSSNGLIIPLVSTAVDGSQIPVGILADDYTILSGTTKSVSICNFGDVVVDKVVLQPGDTLNTLVNGRMIKDRIIGDTAGVRLIANTELTGFDN